MRIKYYLVNGVDRSRDSFMKNQFDKAKIPQNEILWIKSHNKTELTEEFINKNCMDITKMKLGQLSCTYKHYLALKDMVENNIDIGIIMEDNIEFNTTNFPKNLKEYLRELPADWDLLFESDTLPYIESPIDPKKKIYRKNINITWQCQGGTNAANCYIIPLKTAKLFYNVYLPIPIVVDFYMNDLIRKYNLNVYWAVPPVVHRIRRKSTALYD